MSQTTLVEISKSEARLGMFVHGFGKQWLNSPFGLHQFKLTDPAHLETLQASSVRTLIIDLSKGVGPAPAAAPPRKVEARPRRPEAEPETRQIAATLTQTTAAVRSIFTGAAVGRELPLRQIDSIVGVVGELVNARPTTVLSLNRLKSKDEISFQHSISVCALVGLFTKHLNFDAETARLMGIAALLHDIGKVHIPQSILKKTDGLTDDETAVMRKHPTLGYEVLVREAGLPDLVRDVCLHHHERPDGTGYPEGLAGEEISTAARIVAICDVFDALTTVRPYKKGWPAEVAGEKMVSWHGQFDDELLNEFLICLGLRQPVESVAETGE